MTSDTLWTEATRLQGIQISLIRQVMNNAQPGAINMALGELAFPMPEYLREAALKIIRQGNAGYTPNAGLRSLRQQVAQYYGDTCQAEQICICNGAEEAVYLTLLSLVNPGAGIAIPDPDYTAYPAIAQMMGATVKRLPLSGKMDTIDWDIWESTLSDNVQFLLLSTPSNPCGMCFSAKDLSHLAAICNHRRIVVIVDEIYKHLYIKKSQPAPDKEFPNLIRIGGLSKSHCMSGWRIGWVNAPLEIAPAIIKAKQYVSTCAPWVSQKLAEVALSPEGWQQAEQLRQRLAANQTTAVNALKSSGLPMIIPPAGPYLMLNIQNDCLNFAAKAAKNGLICVPGSAFGSVSKGWIRINIAIAASDLAKGLQILKGMI